MKNLLLQDLEPFARISVEEYYADQEAFLEEAHTALDKAIEITDPLAELFDNKSLEDFDSVSF